MDVRTALRQAADEIRWGRTQVAAAAGVSENTIGRFYDGSIVSLRADAVVALMRALPGFAQRLGFQPMDTSVAHAS
jgi:hypothetical protein